MFSLIYWGKGWVGVGGRGLGVIPSWPMEANSGVRGRDRVAEKALEGMADKQTDRHTNCPLYDDDEYKTFTHASVEE